MSKLSGKNGGLSLWLGKLGLHWSTEEGFQAERDSVMRFGLLGAIRG